MIQIKPIFPKSVVSIVLILGLVQRPAQTTNQLPSCTPEPKPGKTNAIHLLRAQTFKSYSKSTIFLQFHRKPKGKHIKHMQIVDFHGPGKQNQLFSYDIIENLKKTQPKHVKIIVFACQGNGNQWFSQKNTENHRKTNKNQRKDHKTLKGTNKNHKNHI